MPKVPALLGLAAILAAGIALFFFLGHSGAEGERTTGRTGAVVRPGDTPAAPVDADLAASRPVASGANAEAEREAARVAKPEKAGAERVIPASRDGDGNELYGIALGIYGVPVGGAKVEVRSIGDTADGLLQVLGGSTDKETVTAKDGTFRVPRPDRWEEVEVEITARGFLEFSRTMDLVDRDGDQDLGVFELEAGVVLGGKVLDADGKPVAGANVRRVADGDESFRFRTGFGARDGVETDAEGRFEMPHEDVGSYVLVVEHDDHPVGRFPGTTPQPGGEDTSLVLRLPRGATIAGKIEGYPVGREHVRVSAQAVDAESDAAGFAAMLEESGFSADGLEADVEKDGSFSIKGVEVGKRYKVRGYVRGGFFGRTPVSDPETVAAGTTDVELTWDPGGTVVARVVDEATSASVRDVEVRYRWDAEEGDFDFSNQTRTRRFQTGNVELEELRPDKDKTSISLLFGAPGYLETLHENVVVDPKGKVDIGTIRLRPAPVVRLSIVDAEGDPVSRARVRLAPEEDGGDEGGMRGPSGWFSLDKQATNGKTGDDGVLELPAPATATARLEVSHPKYAGYVREGVPMPSAGTRDEEVRLAEGGTIEVTVVDAHGNPVPDMRVRHRYPEHALEDDTASHETNRRGQVRLRNQVAGMHGFRTSEDRASAGGEEPEWTEVAVADGKTAQVVLEVAARASVEGKITESGVALDRADVSLVQVEESALDEVSINISFGSGGRMRGAGGPTRGSDRTDRTGRYEIEEVPAGEYRLKITHEDRAAPHFVPITVHGGGNRLDVDLPVNAVEGRVLDANGAPLAGATLRLIPTESATTAEDHLEREALRQLFGGGRRGGETGPDGTYRLRGVPTDQPFRVEASLTGYVAARSDEVTVTEGQTKRGVDVKLTTGGTLRVRVTGSSNSFLFLSASWDGGGDDPPKVQMQMVRGGEAVFQGLEPGPWIVRRSNDADGPEQRVDVLPTGETAIDLAL